MQHAGWGVDPAQDDLAAAVGEASDAAREVAHEGVFARRERQRRQRMALVVGGPAGKGVGRIGPAFAACADP